nr:hypothetical protein [Saccharofermentans sp.]
DSLFSSNSVKEGGIIEASLKDMKSEDISSTDDTKIASDGGEIVFAQKAAEEVNPFVGPITTVNETFDPYSVGSSDQMQSTAPLVFEDKKDEIPSIIENKPIEVVDAPEAIIESENLKDEPEIEAPQYGFEEVEYKAPSEEEKLKVDFPETNKIESAPVVPQDNGDFVLPFANGATTIPEQVATTNDADIPQMPIYSANDFEAPISNEASSGVSESQSEPYIVGQYGFNEENAAPDYQQGYQDAQTQVPYNSYGAESFEMPNQNQNANYGYQTQPQQQYDANAYQQYSDPNAAYGQGAYDYQNPVQGNPVANDYAVDSNSTGTNEDDWINNILGIDEDAFGAGASALGGEAGMSNGYYQSGNSSNPYGQNAPRTNSGRPGGSHPSSGSGRGGNGGNKKYFGLTRNGIIFIGIVAVVLICFVIVISLIVKACAADDKKKKSEETSTTTATMQTVETTPPVIDPAAPIGRFVFSTNIGYRTYRDLLFNVYNIQIEDSSDARIAIITTYNGLDASYLPQAGDILLLPPVEMINGTMAVTTFGSTAAAPTGGVTGEPSIGDSSSSGTGDTTTGVSPEVSQTTAAGT